MLSEMGRSFNRSCRLSINTDETFQAKPAHFICTPSNLHIQVVSMHQENVNSSNLPSPHSKFYDAVMSLYIIKQIQSYIIHTYIHTNTCKLKCTVIYVPFRGSIITYTHHVHINVCTNCATIHHTKCIMQWVQCQ